MRCRFLAGSVTVAAGLSFATAGQAAELAFPKILVPAGYDRISVSAAVLRPEVVRPLAGTAAASQGIILPDRTLVAPSPVERPFVEPGGFHVLGFVTRVASRTPVLATAQQFSGQLPGGVE